MERLERVITNATDEKLQTNLCATHGFHVALYCKHHMLYTILGSSDLEMVATNFTKGKDQRGQRVAMSDFRADPVCAPPGIIGSSPRVPRVSGDQFSLFIVAGMTFLLYGLKNWIS